MTVLLVCVTVSAMMYVSPTGSAFLEQVVKRGVVLSRESVHMGLVESVLVFDSAEHPQPAAGFEDLGVVFEADVDSWGLPPVGRFTSDKDRRRRNSINQAVVGRNVRKVHLCAIRDEDSYLRTLYERWRIARVLQSDQASRNPHPIVRRAESVALLEILKPERFETDPCAFGHHDGGRVCRGSRSSLTSMLRLNVDNDGLGEPNDDAKYGDHPSPIKQLPLYVYLLVSPLALGLIALAGWKKGRTGDLEWDGVALVGFCLLCGEFALLLSGY